VRSDDLQQGLREAIRVLPDELHAPHSPHQALPSDGVFELDHGFVQRRRVMQLDHSFDHELPVHAAPGNSARRGNQLRKQPTTHLT
jgi:hypothetical protein